MHPSVEDLIEVIFWPSQHDLTASALSSSRLPHVSRWPFHIRTVDRVHVSMLLSQPPSDQYPSGSPLFVADADISHPHRFGYPTGNHSSGSVSKSAPCHR